MDTTTEKQQGTSPEILQHYLAAGIDVQGVYRAFPGHPGLRLIGKLKGIDMRFDGSPVILEITPASGVPAYATSLRFTDCLPVLRPFSFLTLPLPSGEVPIVEIAKLALNNNYEPTRRMYQLYDFKRARVPSPYPKEAYAYIDHRKLESKTIKVDADFNVTVSNAVSIRGVNTYNQAAIIDYLRRNHFALPVNGKPLVAGVDYIPLQP